MSIWDLLVPKWRHRNVSVRANAIEKIVDQKKLAKIAQSDPDDELRARVFARLTRETVLHSISSDDQYWGKERIALEERIRTEDREKEEESLKQIALKAYISNYHSEEYRRLAEIDSASYWTPSTLDNYKRVTVLAEKEKVDNERTMREAVAAVQRLSSIARLTEVAGKAQLDEVKKAAVSRISELRCQSGSHSWGISDCSVCDICKERKPSNHSWIHCKCSKCGKTRDESHAWEGCRCTECGRVRDEEHSWSKSDCSECLKCGKIQNENHICDRCKCLHCKQTRSVSLRDEHHLVVGEVCILCGASILGRRRAEVVWAVQAFLGPSHGNDRELLSHLKNIGTVDQVTTILSRLIDEDAIAVEDQANVITRMSIVAIREKLNQGTYGWID
jgi:hypothetical protein